MPKPASPDRLTASLEVGVLDVTFDVFGRFDAAAAALKGGGDGASKRAKQQLDLEPSVMP